MLPRLREVFGKLTRNQIAGICEGAAVGYAPITRPDELFGDPQLKQSGAMVEVTLADGRLMPIPALPLEMNGERFGLRLDIPQAGEHSAAIAAELGCTADEYPRTGRGRGARRGRRTVADAGQGRRNGLGLNARRPRVNQYLRRAALGLVLERAPCELCWSIQVAPCSEP